MKTKCGFNLATERVGKILQIPFVLPIHTLLDFSGLITEKICEYAASNDASNICEMSIELLSFHSATSARIDNRAIDISQIFDAPLEAAYAHIFSAISSDKSRSLWFIYLSLRDFSSKSVTDKCLKYL